LKLKNGSESKGKWKGKTVGPPSVECSYTDGLKGSGVKLKRKRKGISAAVKTGKKFGSRRREV